MNHTEKGNRDGDLMEVLLLLKIHVKDFCKLWSGWENPWLVLGFDKYEGQQTLSETELKNIDGWKDFTLRRHPLNIVNKEIRNKSTRAKHYVKHIFDPEEWNTENYRHPYYITKYLFDFMKRQKTTRILLVKKNICITPGVLHILIME